MESVKISGRYNRDSKLIAAGEISDIVSDNISRPGRECQPQNKIIIRILQKRAPKKMHILMMADRDQIAKKRPRIGAV